MAEVDDILTPLSIWLKDKRKIALATVISKREREKERERATHKIEQHINKRASQDGKKRVA